MSKVSEYVPEIIEEYGGRYAKVLIVVEKCATCNRPMVHSPGRRSKTFPQYIHDSFGAQAMRAGFVIASGVRVDDQEICKECVEQGKATFLCALCGKRRPSAQIEDQYGDPPEFLCSVCYESVPAKEYDAKEQELYAAHRWDYE